MTCNSVDLTIEGALADPVIGAAMRADRIDPRHFETLLRTTARDLRDAERATTGLGVAVLGQRIREAVCGARPW